MLQLGTDEKHFNGSVVTQYCISLCGLECQGLDIQPGGWSECWKDPENVLKVITFFSPVCAHARPDKTCSKQIRAS